MEDLFYLIGIACTIQEYYWWKQDSFDVKWMIAGTKEEKKNENHAQKKCINFLQLPLNRQVEAKQKHKMQLEDEFLRLFLFIIGQNA